MEGYVKLFRSIEKWEWYTDTDTKCLFLHCLIKANHHPRKWHGIIIEAGSFVTSYEHLSTETGISVRSLRTSLNKLKSTGELTSHSTNRFTVINVAKWRDYQSQDDINDTPVVNQKETQETSNRQTTDKQPTTNKNDKNYKNEKNKNKDYVEKAILYLNAQTKHHYKTTDANSKHISARLNDGYTIKQILQVIHNKVLEWEDDLKMKKFLRPETLFGSKFDSYLNFDKERAGYRTHAEMEEVINSNTMHLFSLTGPWDCETNEQP